MTLEPTFSLDETDEPSSSERKRYSSITLTTEGDKLLLVLPTQAEVDSELLWSENWQEFKHLLRIEEQSWQPGTPVFLVAGDRLLDARQLQTIADTLEDVELRLTSVSTNRRQTAVAAATSGYSVEQQDLTSTTQEAAISLLAKPLYVRNTVRSGVEIRHRGTIIVCGDLNPGGQAIAAGDIFVWGRLRGIAHAGADGDRRCRIAALQMEFTQLRIADAVARSPKTRPKQYAPELAFMTTEGIRLAKALDFNKTYTFSPSGGGWVEKNRIN
ncbi:septum site-determining protein MinC [Myxosarcina sp. GI1]|uniref:septum site-determining protein MinC n=1 Tax=Myxosarcina sp. GI1 TaxID=1541065 RepID=UPI00055BF682|nr:septum site-determining protein MinC [Myxosarcina sp. GI1]